MKKIIFFFVGIVLFFNFLKAEENSEMKIIKIFETKMENGYIVFKVEAMNLNKLFLAGTFNNWAENNNGYVSEKKYEFTKISKNIFEKKIKLQPGIYQFKFVVNNNIWITPDNYETDGDKNALLQILPNNEISKKILPIDYPHRSFYDLPFSNGYSSSKFNVHLKKVDSFRNHIYSNSYYLVFA